LLLLTGDGVKARSNRTIFIVILVMLGVFLLAAGTVSTFYVAHKVIRPKMDMTGGTSLIYEIDAQDLSEEQQKDLAQKMIAVLRRRIDPENVADLVWRPHGDCRFEIRIPPRGTHQVDDLQRILKGTGALEFRVLPTRGHPEVDPNLVNDCIESLQKQGPDCTSDGKYVWCEVYDAHKWLRTNMLGGEVGFNVTDAEGRPIIISQLGNKCYVLASNRPQEVMLYAPDENGWRLKGAKAAVDNMGRRAIGFTLDENGARLFAQITGNNIDRPLCILIDSKAMSAPVVSGRIFHNGMITGNFTEAEVTDIVNRLNVGCLPARIIEEPVTVRIIGEPPT
jgi:preprotein translocase subunit SecD